MCGAKRLIRVEQAKGPALVSHRNAPLSFEGRLRLVERCRRRPISHVAAEMGSSRACASKWVNRWRRYAEVGLAGCDSDTSKIPRRTEPQPVPPQPRRPKRYRAVSPVFDA